MLVLVIVYVLFCLIFTYGLYVGQGERNFANEAGEMVRSGCSQVIGNYFYLTLIRRVLKGLSSYTNEV
jgi:hypothetical protein